MRSILLAALCAGILAGCATPNRIRESSAPRIYQSQKSSESVVACIIEKFDGLGRPHAIEISPRGDGGKTIKRINQRTPTIIGFVADVSPTTGGGAVLKLYENHLVLSDERTAVEACGSGQF